MLLCMPSYLEQTAILCTKSSAMHMQPTFREAVRANRPKFRPNGATRGAAAPLLGPNWPIFGGLTPLDLLSEPMWCLCRDKVI
jgi:hypothetical protein